MTPEEKNQQAQMSSADKDFQKAVEEAGSNQSGVGSITDALEAGAEDISKDNKGSKEGNTPDGEKAETTSGV